MVSAHCIDTSPFGPADVPPPPGWRRLLALGGSQVRHDLVRVVAELERWQERRRERAMLWGLDDGALKDLGLSQADAYAESQKPFWRG